MSDTPVDVERLFTKMLLSRTPLERLRMASRMFDTGKKLVFAGLGGMQNLDTPKLRARLFMRIYGSDFSPSEAKKIISSMPDMQLDTDSWDE